MFVHLLLLLLLSATGSAQMIAYHQGLTHQVAAIKIYWLLIQAKHILVHIKLIA